MNNTLYEVVRHNAGVFRDYAQQHIDKNTPESRVKAEANSNHMTRCLEALKYDRDHDEGYRDIMVSFEFWPFNWDFGIGRDYKAFDIFLGPFVIHFQR